MRVPESPVIATVSGATISFTSKIAGAETNFPVITSNSTGQGAYFASPSFAASGAALAGGANGATLATPAKTTYTYNTLDELIQVQQLGTAATCDANCRARNFQYDSLSRLTQATNPETGTINYSYDDNGNLTSKTSPAPNQSSGTQTISYCYDNLNRLTKKFYSANPNCPTGTANVTYFYDQASYNGLTSATALAGGRE